MGEDIWAAFRVSHLVLDSHNSKIKEEFDKFYFLPRVKCLGGLCVIIVPRIREPANTRKTEGSKTSFSIV